MSLTGLSTDELRQILFYSDACAVMKLIECGSAVLNAKLSRVEFLSLTLRTRPFMPFPFSLFGLPHLTSLSLKSHPFTKYYPLRLNGALPVPSTPLSSLVKFSLTCIQSFSVLVVENGIPLLNRFFPNLKKLSLTHSSVSLSLSNMKAVPRGLEKLTLKTAAYGLSQSSLPCSVLTDLPPQLKKLHLRGSIITHDPETKDYSSVVWPIHLRCLRLKTVTLHILNHLPPHVEELVLSMDREETSSPLDPDPFPTHRLPTTLTRLHLEGDFYYAHLRFLPTTWPPALAECLIPFADLTEESMAMVPKSITSMGMSREFYPLIGKLAQILPNIRALPLNGLYESYPASLLSNLPPCLTEFHNPENSVDQIQLIPESIRAMTIRIRPESYRSQPPIIPSSEECDMARLPRNLTSLSLFSIAKDAKFTQSDFKCLPRTLKSLTFLLADIETSGVLSCLPNSLESVSFKIKRGKVTSNLFSDLDLIDHLPTGITEMTIDMIDECVAWPAWMRRMSRFTALKKLEISSSIHKLQNSQVPFDYVASLPRSLNYVKTPIGSVTICPEDIQALPRGLTRLSLSPLVGTQSTASDACFVVLPSPLIYLELPHNMKGLTTELLRILPTSIIDLSPPDNVASHIGIFNSREPEWGGFLPT
jgi:hypothetical protein